MKKLILILTTILAFGVSQNALAQKQSIVDIAVSNEDFSTLVTALQAADLVGALQGDGPFTVFAPTNAAFAKIDANTLNSLLEPKNKATLSSILTYHVVPGKLAAADVVAALKKGNGKAEVKALSGATLTVVQKDGKIWLKDENGNYSQITSTDVMASNGVIHVIGDVVMPK
ncbi:MAG: fasciclin domain-containing protein [Bacteroidia bacterium]|nr:fasciclin domain-containing protein [Bacteroidia bacterium]NNF31016.1 fasciclin domain-containing protein [Flavobacteriaceae bacterium]MBT8276866.1 fasciclin domain-containing protein [Bacteroidia bacterium]NNJ82436.1 fasciclin domain-containing protein [Flavobacteriaceae bacterium]NNK53084.1 fasciclin domain-containing protein [Flavobacteriaceae bacterium]